MTRSIEAAVDEAEPEHEQAAVANRSDGGARLRRNARWVLPGAGVLIALALLAARGPRAQPETPPPARDVPYLDGEHIRYSAAFAQRAGLAFVEVGADRLSPIMHVTGSVRFDPERVAAVGARIAGRVRVLRKLEGDAVAAGDVLAEIESAELGEAQAAVLAARANAVAAEANEKRERQLAEAKISASRDAEAAAATAAAARASLVAAEQRVRAMGGGQGEAGVLIMRSPIAGKVVERNLARGQFVEPTLTAFRVADLHRVWIELAVFERDLHALRGDDRVDISVPGSGTASVFGTVTYVGDIVDLQTKTAKVRVVVDQVEPSLRPGQSVLATIHVSAPRAQRSVLPRDAVTTVDGKPTVFVASGELAVQARGVELGAQDATQVEIVSGIQVGERVASAGVLALKSEIFR